LQLISKLAVVIFTALDHGLQDEEERHLSPDLVALLDAMAAAGQLHFGLSLIHSLTPSYCFPLFSLMMVDIIINAKLNRIVV